jgi:chemotaxis protein methyltransferase CheR
MNQDTLTNAQFEDFRQVIATHLGIKMPPTKRVMLQCRLHRRLRELDLESFDEYHARFFQDSAHQSEEIEHLLNLATTNKTDFFREAAHFEVLAREVVPAWRAKPSDGTFRVWCAGCATGDEPYTLAMVLLEQQAKGAFKFSIFATDVSTRALDVAMRAIYPEEHVAPVPAALKSKYLLRSRDREEPLVRIAPAVRACVRFGHLNFLSPDYGLRDTYDAIFFRNVMIYFDRETQRQVVSRMCGNLRLGGYLFISHSETLQGQPLPLRLVGTSYYQHIGGKPTA